MTVAVITGAGRGLGRGIATALAADGFDVVLGWHRDMSSIEVTAKEVEAAGCTVICVQGDVTEEPTALRLLEAAVQLGGPDAWINNAGISVLAPVLETSAADMARMIDVNLLGTFHGLRIAAQWFADNNRAGRIVNIASELGVQAFPFLGGYAATKFAVVGLTQAAAVELASKNITVNAVCPGTAETDMVLAERASQQAFTGQSADTVRQSYLDAIPAGRFCQPDDVGATVAWLCQPGGAYVTGQAICVNGGSVLH